jgi:nucleotide-binding universal stress UspA family protein
MSTAGPTGEDAVGPHRAELTTDGPATILVGVDGSDSSWRALHYAVGQARRQASRIVAVYVYHLPGFAHPDVAAVAAMGDCLGPQLADSVKAVGQEYDVDIDFVPLEGDPVVVLKKVAIDHHADLIVVGASQKAAHRVFGSTALRCVRARRWPVTVVP